MAVQADGKKHYHVIQKNMKVPIASFLYKKDAEKWADENCAGIATIQNGSKPIHLWLIFIKSIQPQSRRVGVGLERPLSGREFPLTTMPLPIVRARGFSLENCRIAQRIVDTTATDEPILQKCKYLLCCSIEPNEDLPRTHKKATGCLHQGLLLRWESKCYQDERRVSNYNQSLKRTANAST